MRKKRRTLHVILLSGLPLAVRAHFELPDFGVVAPIFGANCVMCHNGPKAPKGLQLTSYENVIKGSTRGPVVAFGDPDGSELVKRIRGTSMPRMPLSGPPWLEDSEIQLIERWIKGGARRQQDADPVEKRENHATTETGSRRVTYADVAPILQMNCVRCHNTRGIIGPPPEGLLLNTYRNVLESRDRARVIPGSPDASELVRRVRGQALPRMPFDGPPYLNEEEIALIEAWVIQGARDSSGRSAEIPYGARVRLHGRLSAPWVLDGLPLLVTGHSDLRKRTGVGDFVEVRGRVTQQGDISVERIRERR